MTMQTLPPARTATSRSEILGCVIDRVDAAQAVDTCERAVRDHHHLQHMAVNAAKIVSMRDDPVLRRIVRDCGLVTADGQAVVWASRILGDPLPERVAGIDLMDAMIASAAAHGHSIYVLGAQREVLEAAIAAMRAEHPSLRIIGYRDGYFTDAEQDAVAEEIRCAQPDMLFVAMSSPRKEYFLARHGAVMDVPFCMGVGGAIDIVAGLTRRAPESMQRLGLEWLFRLVQEPRRMFRRYLVSNAVFIAMVLRGLLRGVGRGRRHA